MPKFTVTYEIITEASAARGEAQEIGFINRDMSLRDAVQAVCATRTSRVCGVECYEPNHSIVRFADWFSVHNGMEYETGARESRALHVPDSVTGESRKRIFRLIESGRY
jgi:hypothetical protein